MIRAHPPSHVFSIVDGTPASDAALAAAVRLATRSAARLTVAACVPAEHGCGRCGLPAGKWTELVRERCAADLERAAEIIARSDGEANLVVVAGCTTREIGNAAGARGCDAIVVAARHPRLSGFVRGLRRHATAEVVPVDPRRESPPVAPQRTPHLMDGGRAFRP
jgi:nucleotide-binding universal stress UspA family protein